MIGYAQCDNAFVQRVGKEVRTANDLYDENYNFYPVDAEKQNTLDRRIRTVSQEMRGRKTAQYRRRPLQSETELIWQDRQYVNNKKTFGEN